jgi:uncharacterized protein YggE
MTRVRITAQSGGKIPLRGIQMLVAIALALAMAVPVVAAPEAQRTGDERPNIAVTGEGEVRVDPDLATVSVGVTATAPTSEEALDQASARMAQVIAATRALGVEQRDIQTSGLSLQPIFRQRVRPDDPQEIESYRASNNVTITVRDVQRAGAVLDAASRSGANVISGIRFGLANPDAARQEALGAAVRDAERKARGMASAAGVNITGVQSIVEDNVATPQPVARAAAAPAVGEATAPPVEPGELIVRARVRATYNI